PRCTDELRTLRAFLAIEPDAEPVGALERLRRVVATLVAPPRTAHPGLRGAPSGGAATYQAGDARITLEVVPAARRGGFALFGMVVASDNAPTSLSDNRVELVGADGAAFAGQIDDLGNFTFEDLVPGGYRLELRLPAQ